MTKKITRVQWRVAILALLEGVLLALCGQTFGAVNVAPGSGGTNGGVEISVVNMVSNRVRPDHLSLHNFGAWGDGISGARALVTSNSVWVTNLSITTAAPLDSRNIGKLMHITGAAAWTNDMVAVVTNVASSNAFALNLVVSNSQANTRIDYGHNDQGAIQAAINATALAEAKELVIPATTTNGGNYFIFSTNWWTVSGAVDAGLYALTLRGKDVKIVGTGGRPHLQFCGAWHNRAEYDEYWGTVQRISGIVFRNDSATNIWLENLEIDGGTYDFNTNRITYPASSYDGDGWDGTHKAFSVIDSGNGGLVGNVTVKDCYTHHWKGEMYYYGIETPGISTFEDDLFTDCNASFINPNGQQFWNRIVFRNGGMVSEFGQWKTTGGSRLVGCNASNMMGGIVFNNNRSNNLASVIVEGWTFKDVRGWGDTMVISCNNVIFRNNVHYLSSYAGFTLASAGAQGEDYYSRQIIVDGDTYWCTNDVVPILLGGFMSDSLFTGVKHLAMAGPNQTLGNVMAYYGGYTNVSFVKGYLQGGGAYNYSSNYDNAILMTDNIYTKDQRYAQGDVNVFTGTSTSNIVVRYKNEQAWLATSGGTNTFSLSYGIGTNTFGTNAQGAPLAGPMEKPPLGAKVTIRPTGFLFGNYSPNTVFYMLYSISNQIKAPFRTLRYEGDSLTMEFYPGAYFGADMWKETEYHKGPTWYSYNGAPTDGHWREGEEVYNVTNAQISYVNVETGNPGRWVTNWFQGSPMTVGTLTVTNVLKVQARLFAAASVTAIDGTTAIKWYQTNRLTAATTLVFTNCDVGELMQAVVPGEASGGTDRNIAIVVPPLDLVQIDSGAMATSATIVATNGICWELICDKQLFKSTNVWQIRTAWAPR